MTATAVESNTAAACLPADVRETLAATFPVAAALNVDWQSKTATRLDTGSWLRRSAVHAAVIGDRFVVVAPGPKPVVRHWPLAAVGKAIYNHVTGELVLPPGRERTESAFPLALDPLVARSLLALASASPPGTLPEGTPCHA